MDSLQEMRFNSHKVRLILVRWDLTHMRWGLTHLRSVWNKHGKNWKTHKISKIPVSWVFQYLMSSYSILFHLAWNKNTQTLSKKYFNQNSNSWLTNNVTEATLKFTVTYLWVPITFFQTLMAPILCHRSFHTAGVYIYCNIYRTSEPFATFTSDYNKHQHKVDNYFRHDHVSISRWSTD